MKRFIGDPEQWNTLISGLPNTHILQTWEWGAFKAKYGWQSFPFIWEDSVSSINVNLNVQAAAMILKRIIPIKGFSSRSSILYIPKGPLMDWDNRKLRERVLDDLESFAKEQESIFIKMDPELLMGTGIPGTSDCQDSITGLEAKKELDKRHWTFSKEQIQFRNTVMIDLTQSDDLIRSKFKQKTRYNINLAIRKGISVRRGTIDDLPLLYRMYAETSNRDGFIIRDENYYLQVWNSFMTKPSSRNSPFAVPLIAEFEGKPVAAVFVFCFSTKAYYLYGMSGENHREKMPNYLLQWEAIKLAKEFGCTEYDLWGAPDEFNENDPLWGVFRFKVGLGGTVIRSLGAWDNPSKPLLYKIYTRILPGILELMRSRGRSRIKRDLGN
jgi:lipid II:glycine glycyltransferase (peptidoglycan interpeptide bridge formation enzyme)